jgi:hypothetical protein
MIRYFHKYKKNEPVEEPLFGYFVNVELKYSDKHFRISSIFESKDEPLKERRKAMEVYGETRKIIEFLTRNGYFDDTTMEFTSDVYSRISNDEIKILGNGLDEDAQNLTLEYETLKLYGYIPPDEPTMTLIDPDGAERIILMTDLT